MKQTLTIKVKILPTEDQIVLLKKTQKQYIKACQYVSDYIFNNDFILEQRAIHDNLYFDIKESFSLPAQLSQSVMRTVISNYKTTQTQLKKKPYIYKDSNNKIQRIYKDLSWLWSPLKYKNPFFVLVRDRSYSFKKDNIVSLSTLNGRINVPYVWVDNNYFNKFKEDFSFDECKVLEIDNKWYIHFSVSRDIEESKEKFSHVVGIDRGLRNILTTYDEKGHTEFYSGKKVLAKRRKYKKLRKELQEVNTLNSKRKIRKIGQKENRWMTNVNHNLSKALIDKYGSNTLFVLEDLENVTFNTVKTRKKDNRYEHYSWAFYQFEQFLIYKAISIGSTVITVDSHYTSQRCPKCGTIDKNNRHRDTHSYYCKSCGYESNDDRIAAMNIQLLGTYYVSGEKKPKFEKQILN